MMRPDERNDNNRHMAARSEPRESREKFHLAGVSCASFSGPGKQRVCLERQSLDRNPSRLFLFFWEQCSRLDCTRAGLVAKQGVKVNLIFATGRRPTQALVAGEVQFISTAAAASIPAAVAGADIVILAGASNVSPLEIFSKPDIKQPEQLRGRRLGITTFGSSTDAAARFALPKWGLRLGADVVLLQLGGEAQRP